MLLMTVGIASAGMLGYIVLNAQKNTLMYQDIAQTSTPASDLRKVSAESDPSVDQYEGIRSMEEYDEAEYGLNPDMTGPVDDQGFNDPFENELEMGYTQP